MTLQEAKHQVAKNHGFTEFGKMLHLGVNLPSVYYNEASELYATSKWKEGYDVGFSRARSILDPDSKKIQDTSRA
jgi:hypothetical protein